jgi:hypothetical protein
MPNYSNPKTKLTASAYTYSVTLTRGPLRVGRNEATDTNGTYTAQPGETVGDFLTKIANWFSYTYKVPRKDVTVVRYSLRERSR